MGVTDSGEMGSPIPHIFFFVGHFNDVDHLMPVAYKFCQSNRGKPVVVVTDPLYDIGADYRLRFLQDRYHVPVISVLKFHPANPLTGWLVSLLSSRGGKGALSWWRFLVLRVLRKGFYSNGWAGRVLDRYQPAALVVELAQRTGGIPGKFVAEGRGRGIPSIALHHGMFIYTNELVNRQEQLEGRTSREYANMFDRSVCQSYPHVKRLFEEGVRPDKMAVLGSARYCEEWQRVNLEIQSERFTAKKGWGCTYRVVFMLPQWNYNAGFRDTMQALRRLAAEPWLHVVLKPHTREVNACPEYLKELEALPNVEVAGNGTSVALIQWSDAVIVVGSSIVLEALAQGKAHLDPTYLHDNTTIFEAAGAEWTVHSDEELVAALKQLSEGQQPPYGSEEVSKVVAKLVLGDSSNPDVLSRYVDFILGGWRAHPTYKDWLEASSDKAGAGDAE